MQSHERVLIVLVKSAADGEIIRTRNWYRLPVKNGPREIACEWIAFYQPDVFGDERRGIYRYARIRETNVVRRVDLLPGESDHPRANAHYFAISFEPPIRLARPIVSEKARRFVWTQTTLWRFSAARTLDDLFSDEPLVPPDRDRVLVGVVPRVSDLDIARDRRWYRVRRSMVRDPLTPGHVAFYLGSAFGADAGTIRHYAPVLHADVARRVDLLPDEPRHPRAHDEYIRYHLDDIRELPRPIRSAHERRIVLLPTTWERFARASDLNELVTGDAGEETFYSRMREEGLRPERAYYVRGANAYYLTDFAFFCRRTNAQVDLEGGDNVLVTYPDGRTERADGWEALRLSRFEIARYPAESVRRVRELVAACGGTAGETGRSKREESLMHYRKNVTSSIGANARRAGTVAWLVRPYA